MYKTKTRFQFQEEEKKKKPAAIKYNQHQATQTKLVYSSTVPERMLALGRQLHMRTRGTQVAHDGAGRRAATATLLAGQTGRSGGLGKQQLLLQLMMIMLPLLMIMLLLLLMMMMMLLLPLLLLLLLLEQ
jgi:hypothetical protein